MNIIAIELENDQFYIQISKKSAETVFEEHLEGEVDCIFTQKYKPISFVLEKTNANKDDFKEVMFRKFFENINYKIICAVIYLLWVTI